MSPVEVLATRTRICDRIKVCLFFWSIIFSGLKVNLQFRGHLDPLIDSQTRLWSMLILVTNVSTPPSLTRHPFAERKGLVMLQPSSCRHARNLMWPIRSGLFIDRICCHGVWMSASYYLTAIFDKCVPWWQLGSCSMTRPFLSLQRVWLVRLDYPLDYVIYAFMAPTCPSSPPRDHHWWCRLLLRTNTRWTQHGWVWVWSTPRREERSRDQLPG